MPRPVFRLSSGAPLFTGSEVTQVIWDDKLQPPPPKLVDAASPRMVMSPRWKPTTYLWEWEAPDSFGGANFSTSTSAAHVDPVSVGAGATRHAQSPRYGHSDVRLLLGTDPLPERKPRTISSSRQRTVRSSPREGTVAAPIVVPHTSGAPATGSLATSRRAARQQLRELQGCIADERRHARRARANMESALRWTPHNPQWQHETECMPFRKPSF